MPAFKAVCLSFIVALAATVARGQQVAATLSAGSLPYGVAVDNANGLLHVLNSGGNSVSSFNLSTRALVHTTAVGSSPEGIAVSSSGVVYVASTFSNAVTIIKPASNYAVSTVGVGTHPQAIAVNPVNGKVYVACYSSYPNNQIYIINPANNNSSTSVYSASAYPWRIAVDSGNGTVYVASSNGTNTAATSLTAINPTTNATTAIPVGRYVQAVVADPNSHTVYAANQNDNNVSVIVPSGSSYTTSTVQVGSAPVALTLDANGKVYVGASSASVVDVLDPANAYALTAVPVPNGPTGLAFEAGTNTVIAIAGNNNKAFVIALPSLAVTSLATGSYPYAIDVSAAT